MDSPYAGSGGVCKTISTLLNPVPFFNDTAYDVLVEAG